MKQILSFFTITLILIAATGCIDRPSSGIEPEPSVVYVNLSEDHPSGIDTLFVGPADSSLLQAGTFAPLYPPNYEWSVDNDAFAIVNIGGDGSAKMVTALGDSGETGTITVQDIENDGAKEIYAKVLKWANPAVYTHIGDFGGHHYFISKQPANWGAAKDFCLEEGGYLASITSEEENTWLHEAAFAVADTNVWLGAATIIPPGERTTPWGVETWESGEAWEYENWGTKAEINTTTWEQFLSMRDDGKWNNMSPVPFLYILEIDYKEE